MNKYIIPKFFDNSFKVNAENNTYSKFIFLLLKKIEKKLKKEAIKIFNSDNCINIEYIQNKKYNKLLLEKNSELEIKNKEMKDEINRLQKNLEEQISKNQKLKEKIIEMDICLNNIKKLEKNAKTILKEYDKKLGLVKKELMLKEKKIKEMEEMNNKMKFELSKNENSICITFISQDENIHYSIIGNNSEIFSAIEKKLYEKYPEYIGKKHHFICKGKKIKRFKSLKDNGIDNNDIIYMNLMKSIY